MNYEVNRLQTFHEWPSNSAVSPAPIAKAGFFYTGPAQVVQCFLCGVTVSEWTSGDQAVALHQTANPDCPFVLNPDDTCNVPLIAATNDSVPSNSRDNNSNLADMDLTKYINRLKTFENWPIPAVVSPERLARSGFYYLQQTDMVECVYCQGVVLRWEPGDDPDREHRIHFPNCDFYSKGETDEDLSAEKVELGNVKLMPGTTSNFTELCIQHHSAPRQPKHATYEGRLRTFDGWPSELQQTPEMLADAGFYYVGSSDQVRCFHCDGGLRNWEETDDAWIEHAKWFPKCGYVGLVKGQDFVKQCIEKRPPLDDSVLNIGPDEHADVSVTPRESPTAVVSQNPMRRISDTELERLLSTEPATAALEIGLHVGRVKMALKRRMEQTGTPYANADQLIEDATRIQLGEEDNIATRQTPDSPSSELTQLLNQIISVAEAASSSSDSHSDSSRLIGHEKESCRISEVSTVTEVKSTDNEQTQQNEAIEAKTAHLEEENRRLREARQCKICMDREVGVVFLPCGHLSTCVFCAPSLTHCPMCRHEIRATVRTFLV
ncbi:hypothetical protein QAD02_014418 [Eretmocerus hayati]|uniref:Uncharacterized protein n=1 Tax=Eretmocerus hayati TaxID=131215 RepID=A0ACC2P6I0_9HYME|nr:hypothetical protein QAD02_014418 [Eretmocerus hayati]